MRQVSKTTIATLRLATDVDVHFDLILAEMENTLTAPGQPGYRLDLINENVAVFDFASTRITLANLVPAAQGELAYFLVAIGTPPHHSHSKTPCHSHQTLCKNIVQGISEFYDAVEVTWQELDEVMTPDMLDDCRPNAVKRSPPPKVEDAEFADNIVAMPTLLPVSPAANGVGHMSTTDYARLRSIRDALYVEAEEEPSIRPGSPVNRLAATAIDASLIMVCLPVGAAMLTYHLLGGGEMRRTAHIVTLTGLFMSASQSAMAQQIISVVL